MSEIEKIQKYIERTKMGDRNGYCMKCGEMLELASVTDKKPVDAVVLAFNYGMAKGYRMAKSEARR